MLTTMHNREIFLSPLRNQEAVLSSKMEGTISTLDEILEYDAEYGDDDENHAEVRSEIVETILYRRTMLSTQKSIAEGRPVTTSLIKSMHQQLLSYGRGTAKSPGQFKTKQETARSAILPSPRKTFRTGSTCFSNSWETTHIRLSSEPHSRMSSSKPSTHSKTATAG